jgi:carbamoyl-phosphate synthase small subunit
VEITSQNHGFAVDMDTLDKHDVEITHINLNDNTLEGFRHKKLAAFCGAVSSGSFSRTT